MHARQTFFLQRAGLKIVNKNPQRKDDKIFKFV